MADRLKAKSTKMEETIIKQIELMNIKLEGKQADIRIEI